MAINKNLQGDFWDSAEATAAAAAELHAAEARLAQEHADTIETAIWRIVEVGLNGAETRRQIRGAAVDELIAYARELDACRHA